jgi:hypothetical protein
MSNESDLERREGEALDDYIRRLEKPDTEVMDAEQRRRLTNALAKAREAHSMAAWLPPPPMAE